MKKSIWFLIFYLSCFVISCKQNSTPKAIPQTGVYLDTFWSESEDTLLYRMLLPTGFSVTKKYPLILFLHGMGERGTDNKLQLVHGSKLFLDSIDQYPSIVIFPQCPETDFWANIDRSGFGEDSLRLLKFHTDEGPSPAMSMVMNLVSQFTEQYFIDTSRIYLSGLSMGGMGSFDILWRMPNTFAACMPICGSGPIDKAAEFSKTPFWIFHGAKDRVVDPNNSIKMVEALNAQNAKVRFSLYPEATHNSWDSAFAEPGFFQWMFSQKR